MQAVGKKVIPGIIFLLGIGSFMAQELPIYGEGSKPVGLSKDAAQCVVGVLILTIFALMAMELCTPQVLLLSSLIICLLLQILTLTEALAGK